MIKLRDLKVNINARRNDSIRPVWLTSLPLAILPFDLGFRLSTRAIRWGGKLVDTLPTMYDDEIVEHQRNLAGDE